MSDLRPGDAVVCRIREDEIINSYANYYEYEYIFNIISNYEDGYIIYVPSSIFLKDTIDITINNYKKYNADRKFIDSIGYYITDHKIASIYSRLDGCLCKICGDFSKFAKPNQMDETFICWCCRKYRC